MPFPCQRRPGACLQRIASIALLASMLGCYAAASTSPAAQSLFAAGDYAGAERAADRELAQAPDDASLWRLKIEAAARRGEYARATRLYRDWHHQRRHYDPAALRALAIGTLWHGLSARDPAMRAQALDAVGALPASRALQDEVFTALEPLVVGLVKDGGSLASAHAARVLLRRGRKAAHKRAAVSRALALAQDPRPAIRAEALAALAEAEGAKARAAMRNALADPDPGARALAVSALGRQAGAADWQAIMALAAEDRSGVVRASALRALGQKQHAPDSLLALARQALGDSYVGARLAGLAIIAAAASDDESDKQQATLRELADSSDLYLALRAAVSLRKRGIAPPQRTLTWALSHPEWPIRVAALNALAEIVSPGEALTLLGPPLTDSRIEVRLAAARVLARLGHPARAAAIFASALRSPRDEARVEAAMDLVRLGDRQGLEALISLARSPSPKTRRAVARAYRYTDNPTLPLVDVLGDPAAEVRIEAAATLLALLR